jgi:hypothetical protein
MIAADPSDTAVTPATRRLVLGVALLAALALALPPRSSPANAQPATPAATEAPAAAAGERAGARITIDAGPRSGSTAGAKADGAGDGVKARIVIDAHSGAASGSSAAPAAGDATADERREIVVDRNGRKVRVMGLGGDAEFDSFNDLVRQEPWLGALIFFSVAMVFLVPVLLVLALIWYKMRKNRMLNETMLKLAEKGVVPPADALDAISGNSVRASPAGNALFERAREVRKRTAWSDLRKGVVMSAFGLALTFYSMLDDGSPNGLGLVLLFVGAGYVVLWWLEDRRLAPSRPDTGAVPPASQ